jgi:predicted nucleic acid-binding protein
VSTSGRKPGSPSKLTGPIFLDANIPMYAAGAPSPFKMPCVRILEAVAKGRLDAVTDVEVFQEILYRYHAIQKPQAAAEIAIHFRQCVPNALPVVWDDTELAIKLLHRYNGLKPRDAIHAAVMLNHGITRICSADQDFDRITEIERIDPLTIQL